MPACVCFDTEGTSSGKVFRCCNSFSRSSSLSTIICRHTWPPRLHRTEFRPSLHAPKLNAFCRGCDHSSTVGGSNPLIPTKASPTTIHGPTNLCQPLLCRVAHFQSKSFKLQHAAAEKARGGGSTPSLATTFKAVNGIASCPPSPLTARYFSVRRRSVLRYDDGDGLKLALPLAQFSFSPLLSAARCAIINVASATICVLCQAQSPTQKSCG
jgi:hypothetical protein